MLEKRRALTGSDRWTGAWRWFAIAGHGARDQVGPNALPMTMRQAFAGALVFAGYYVGAKLGFALTLQPQPVSVLWPPNSILMAALLLAQPRLWWFLIAAAFPAHYVAQWQGGVPLAMMFCWFISNASEAVLGAACVRWLARGHFDFKGLRDVAIFIAGAVFLAPFLSSFVDAAFVALNQFGAGDYWHIWRTRFFSNALAVLTLVSVIVSWGNMPLASLRQASRGRVGEAVLLSLGLLIVSFLVFVWLTPGKGMRPALVYVPLPFLLWAAVRFGFRGTSASILALALVAIWGAAHGRGPFFSRTPLENAVALQLFLIAVAIPLLCLSAVLLERHAAEEAHRHSEARYREVIETQTDLICRFLPDTTLTFVNEAYCRFFQRRREELIGTRFIELIPKEARPRALSHIMSLIDNPRSETNEHEVLSPDGNIAWHQWVDHPISGPEGRVIEFQSIGRDITDRKKAEAATEKLTHVSRLAVVGELTASIVHEISQPLGAILSNAHAAEMLLDAAAGDVRVVKQILADIRKDDERASEVIRHMRGLLRSRQLEMHPLSINEVVSESMKLTSNEARWRGITLQTEMACGLPSVKGARIELQQVLLNLALNGMDAMADTPAGQRRLILQTRRKAQVVAVTVQDNGCGVSPEYLPKLFESFFTTKKDGMGLGLSISRAIIEMHHGKIWGENNTGRGATFGFLLPAITDRTSHSSGPGMNACQEEKT